MLASERTFASWIGTGLGCVGVAIGLEAVFGKTEIPQLGRVAATIFLVVGAVLVWSAHHRATAMRRRLTQHEAELGPRAAYTLISALVTLGLAGTCTVLWLL